MVIMKELEQIRNAYFLKARKDRKTIRDLMISTFGYGNRQVHHKLHGRCILTDSEKEFLFVQLKLENQTK